MLLETNQNFTAVAPLAPANEGLALNRSIHVLPIPWRDPSTVSPEKLIEHIAVLEKACLEFPNSPDLRTCLGMAYAMDHQVYKSMDALHEARQLDANHFFAQLKYAELLFRLRALPRAEIETAKAIELAGNGWELSMARKQLQEIRTRIREGTQKPEWNKPLRTPVLLLVALLAILSSVIMVAR
jgi:hypothetical protein